MTDSKEITLSTIEPTCFLQNSLMPQMEKMDNKKMNIKHTLKPIILILLFAMPLVACDLRSYREKFFSSRPCKNIQFKCLPESQPQENKITILNEPYELTEQDMDSIKKHKTEIMYDEIIQMIEIYHPDFWAGKTEGKAFQMAWVAKVDKLTKRYYPRRSRGKLEIMTLICAIIGTDFETDAQFNFIVKRMKSDKGIPRSPSLIYDWLRFEVLKKDYDDAGTQYNNWSLRGADRGMPSFTRHVPSFSNEWLPDNPDEEIWLIYKRKVRYGGSENKQ